MPIRENVDLVLNSETTTNKITVSPSRLVVKVKAGSTKKEVERIFALAQHVCDSLLDVEQQTFRGSFKEVPVDGPIHIMMKTASGKVSYCFKEKL